MFKKVGFIAISSAMRFCLFVSIMVAVLVITFGSSTHVKTALIDAKAYERFVPAVIAANIKSDQEQGSLPFNNKEVQQIILNSFPPDMLQTKSEVFIDSFYQWLKGNTAAPEFVLDFTSAKYAMAENLSAYAFRELLGKPICDYQPEVIDPFYSDCRPSNMDYAAEQHSLMMQIFTSDSFLKDTVITNEDFAKDANGQTFLQKYDFAPALYQWLMRAPFILITLTFASATAYIFISRRKREGFYAVGFALIGSSVSLVLLTLVFGFILPKFTDNLQLGLGGTGTQAIMDETVQRLTKNFDSMVINISLQVAAVGAVVVFLERFTRPASKYYDIAQKAGLSTGIRPTKNLIKNKINASEIPIITSEAKYNRPKDDKYRKIPKGGF